MLACPYKACVRYAPAHESNNLLCDDSQPNTHIRIVPVCSYLMATTNALQVALESRLRTHPDDLEDVVRSLRRTYAHVRRDRAADPPSALAQLDALLIKVQSLLQLPADVVPVADGAWKQHLQRIQADCEAKRATLLGEAEHVSKSHVTDTASTPPIEEAPVPTRYDHTLPDTMLAPWIQDWHDPTLQTTAARRLVRHVVLPILYPSAYAASMPGTGPSSSRGARHPHTVLLAGPADTGKSYALQAIRRYLRRRQASVRWVHWTAYECPTAITSLLDEGRRPPAATPAQSGDGTTSLVPEEWTVYVTDRVATSDLAEWCTQPWLRAWDHWLDQQSRSLWVVSVTTDETLSTAVTRRFTTRIPFAPPDGRTVYHLLRKLLVRQYGHVRTADGGREPPPFARLPILEDFHALAAFADRVAATHASFADLEGLFQRAVWHCTRLAMVENVMYKPGTVSTDGTEGRVGTGDWWYPKNSVELHALGHNHDDRLIYPLDHDTLEWCPATRTNTTKTAVQCSTEQTTFLNVQLLDTLPTAEYDRLVHLYVDPATVKDAAAPTYQVIANFPVKTRVFPYHLHDGFDRCYEWAIALWLATTAMDDDGHRVYTSLLSTRDLCAVPEATCDALFEADTPPMTFDEVVEAYQVLYVERTPTKNTNDTRPVPRVHLAYGEKRSQDIVEYVEGIPGDMRAETMQQVLQVLVGDLGVEVVQVQTHAGYAYYIDMASPLTQPLVATAADDHGDVQLMPRVSLLATTGGPHLDDTYRLTSESDVDALTEVFPREYKDVYREEEDTWKLMKPRAPEHLALLNRKYSHETKFYLKLYGDLLQAKRRHYTCLNPKDRTVLDNAITDLQNHLDYHQLLIGENDHEGKWNAVWSMSPSHPAYEQYHPPAQDEVDKVVAVDLATDWMQKDMQYHVSPRWLAPFYTLATRFNDRACTAKTADDHGSPTALSPMQQLFRTWRWYMCEPVQETTHWLYAKAAVDKQQWADSASASRLLGQAFPRVSMYAKTPATAGGHPGDANRGGCATDASVDDVYDTSDAPPATPARASTDTALPCLQDARYLQAYAERTTRSLFHTVLRHASYLGRHATDEGHIVWHEVKQGRKDDPLDATLAHLGRRQDVWALLSKNCAYGHAVCHPWLFALNMCALCADKPGVPVPPAGATLNYHELYAHLLAFPTLHYWALDGGHDVLDDIQRQAVWDHTVCQYAFVHKHVHRRPLPLQGPLPAKYTRTCLTPTEHVALTPSASKGTKAVMPADALGKVRVYGLAMHHLEDCWEG